MNHESKSVDQRLLLAEFAALRAEILQRQNMQWNIFALQLTAAGVVFSFALSNPAHTGFLLILPIITYALTGRYVGHSISTQRLATYIREILEVRTNGELHWETWHRSQPNAVRSLTFLNPLFLAFPGVALIAIVWVAPYVWAGHSTSTGERVLIFIVWVVGIAITALSFQLIGSRIASRYWGTISLRWFIKRSSGVSKNGNKLS
jgi:hypothetical protein